MFEFFTAMMGFGLILIFLMLAIAITIYVLLGVFLNKFNKLVEGKGTAFAWIPFLNIYLLGKLLINKIFGWVVVITSIVVSVLTTSSSTTINGETVTKSILKEPASTIIGSVWSGICLVLLIWAIVKYFQVKKASKMAQTNTTSNLNTLNQNINQTQVQNTNQDPNQTINWNSNDPNGSNL